MIVLDTNVLSETVREQPDPPVLAWLGSQTNVATTSITVGELLTGARLLPHGQRRDALLSAIEDTVGEFRDSVLPYDESAAAVYAELQEQRTAAGRPLSVEDGMIAAICRCRGCPLATRNVKDFLDLGIDLINPWDVEPES